MQTGTHVSRRTLLSGGAASLALPFVPRTARAQAAAVVSQPAPVVSEAAWRELGRRISGGVLRPNDPRFVELTQPENLRYYNPPGNPGGRPDPDAPFAVVRPLTPSEVAYAIKWSRENSVPMVPRSGGHSYAGCSTIRGLVINASAMRSVKVEDGLVEAAGGAIFGDMLAGLRDIEGGRYTVTHGRCRSVGLSAYLMGGGWALDSSFLGMGCDRVKKVEMVLADGQVVRASEDGEHRDLFWAIRGGGGGNLGFATKWWLDPVPVQNVVAFSGNWRLSSSGAKEAFHTLLRALDAAPPEMGAEMTMSALAAIADTPWPYAITLSCEFHGARADFDSIMGAALAAADRIASADCKSGCSSQDCVEIPYWDAQEFFEVRGSPNRYHENSLFARDVSDAFIDKIFDLWAIWPKNVSAARLTTYRVGGKVNAVKPDATAFVHRTYKWMVTTDIDWSSAGDPHLDENLKWQQDDVFNTFFAMLGRPGSYQNFPDPALTDHATAYWATNLPRLLQIKGRYDPDFVFTPPRNQGISPGPQATRVPTAQPSGQRTSP